MESDTLHQIVRQAESNYINRSSNLGKYVTFDMYDTVEKIFAYLNSKHTSGVQDSLGRDKPFFNIVTAAVNIWYRATDLDRKDVVVLPNKSKDYAVAFMATVLLQDWMKRNNFGMFLNQWGRTLAQYGSAVVKFIEKNGELIPSVIPWNRFIADPVQFEAIPRIEKFYKTPAQLKNMSTKGHPDYAGYNSKVVEALINSRETRKTLDGQEKDSKDDFIELYEVHAELSAKVYKESKGEETKEADKDIYFQQMHVLSYITSDNYGDEYEDFTLYSGKEKKDPYMLTHLIEEDGRTLAIGAVEYLFDAQWMANHSMKAWKDQMDLSSRLIFQTADPRFVGKNVLTNIEVGQILQHDMNKPVELFPNTGHDISSIQSFATQWLNLGREVTSTPEAARGVTPPSGTALGTVQIVTSQGLSLFELMTENKGLYLEQMLRVFVIPFLKSKMDTTEEISTLLEDRDITKLDKMYIPNEAIRKVNRKVFKNYLKSGKQTSPEEQQAMLEEESASIQEELSALGNQRFFKPSEIPTTTWKEALKNLEWDLDMGITNEQHDKAVILQTLTQVLQTIAGNPLVLQDPNMKFLFNKILSFTGSASPVEISAVSGTPSPYLPSGQSPQGQPTGAVGNLPAITK